MERAEQARSIALSERAQGLIHQALDLRPIGATSGAIETGWIGPDGMIIAVDQKDSLGVWRLPRGERLVTLEALRGRLVRAAWSVDGSRALALDSWGEVVLWDLTSGGRLMSLNAGQGATWAGWGPGGESILANVAGSALAWDSSEGRGLSLLPEGCSPSPAAWAPDGRRLVGLDECGKACVWSVASGRVLAILEGGDRTISGLQWAEDGSSVKASGLQHALAWDAGTGRLLGAGSDLGPDPRTQGWAESATVAVRTTADRLDLATAKDLAAYACTRLQRELTPDEWSRYVSTDEPYRGVCP
jgi:WD40 repeat protein